MSHCNGPALWLNKKNLKKPAPITVNVIYGKSKHEELNTNRLKQYVSMAS